MKFAHALHDGLARFEIGLDAEGRIFGGKPRQTLGHLLLVGLRLGFHRDLDHRVGEGHGFQHHRLLRIAQRVPGGGFLEPCQRDDVAREGLVDFLAVVGVHHHHPADALFLALRRVQHLVALLQDTRVDAGEGERADERVVHDLEGERREGLVVVGMAGNVAGFALVARGETHVGGHVQRAGQVVDHRVEQRLHTLVLEGRAAKNGNEIHR